MIFLSKVLINYLFIILNMGASALKIQDGIDLENLPSFHYLDRKNNQIYKITNCNIFKSDFKAKIQLFDECALIDLSPFEFC